MLVPAPPRVRQPVHMMGMRYADGTRKFEKRSTVLKRAVKGIPTMQLLVEAEDNLRSVVISNEVRRRTHVELLACDAEHQMIKRDSIRFTEVDQRFDLTNEANVVWQVLTTQFRVTSPGLLPNFSICLSQLMEEHSAGSISIFREENQTRSISITPNEMINTIIQLPHLEWRNRSLLEINSHTELSALHSRHSDNFDEKVSFDEIIRHRESNYSRLEHLRRERLSFEQLELFERGESEDELLVSLLKTHQRVRDGFKQLRMMDVPGKETINRGYVFQWEQGSRSLLLLKFQRTIHSAAWLESVQHVERIEWEARTELEHISASEHLQHWITFQRGWCDVQCVVVQGEPARRLIAKSELSSRETIESIERNCYNSIQHRYKILNQTINDILQSLYDIQESEKWVRKGLEISTDSAYLSVVDQQEASIRSQAFQTALSSLEDEEQIRRRHIYRELFSVQVDVLFDSVKDKILIDEATHRLAIVAYFIANHQMLISACFNQLGKLQQSTRLLGALSTSESQSRDQIHMWEYLSHSRLENYAVEVKKMRIDFYSDQTETLISQLEYAERHQRLLLWETAAGHYLYLQSEQNWKQEYLTRDAILSNEASNRKKIYFHILTAVESHNRVFVEGESAYHFTEDFPIIEFYTREELVRNKIRSIENHCIEVYDKLHCNHLDVDSAKQQLLPFINVDTSQYNYPTVKKIDSVIPKVRPPSAKKERSNNMPRDACITGTAALVCLEAVVMKIEQDALNTLQRIGKGYISRIKTWKDKLHSIAKMQGFGRMILSRAVVRRLRMRKKDAHKKRIAAVALEVPSIAILDPVPEDVLLSQQLETNATFTSLTLTKQTKPNISTILLQFDARSIHRKEIVGREAIVILYNQIILNSTREFWDTLPDENLQVMQAGNIEPTKLHYISKWKCASLIKKSRVEEEEALRRKLEEVLRNDKIKHIIKGRCRGVIADKWLSLAEQWYSESPKRNQKLFRKVLRGICESSRPSGIDADIDVKTSSLPALIVNYKDDPLMIRNIKRARVLLRLYFSPILRTDYHDRSLFWAIVNGGPETEASVRTVFGGICSMSGLKFSHYSSTFQQRYDTTSLIGERGVKHPPVLRKQQLRFKNNNRMNPSLDTSWLDLIQPVNSSLHRGCSIGHWSSQQSRLSATRPVWQNEESDGLNTWTTSQKSDFQFRVPKAAPDLSTNCIRSSHPTINWVFATPSQHPAKCEVTASFSGCMPRSLHTSNLIITSSGSETL